MYAFHYSSPISPYYDGYFGNPYSNAIKPADPSNVGQKPEDLNQTDPSHDGSKTEDPQQIDPNHVDPSHVDPHHVDPNHVDPNHVDPHHVELKPDEHPKVPDTPSDSSSSDAQGHGLEEAPKVDMKEPSVLQPSDIAPTNDAAPTTNTSASMTEPVIAKAPEDYSSSAFGLGPHTSVVICANAIVFLILYFF